MAGNLTVACLKEVGNQTAAGAVDEGMEAALDLLGVPLQGIGKGDDRVVIEPKMFQREPGLRTSPELLSAARASACGAEVLIAERTQVFKEILDAFYEHREAGAYPECCPPQDIRAAGIRCATGHDVTEKERTRFRFPTRLSDDSRPLSWSASEELV